MIFGNGETITVHRNTINVRTGDPGADSPHDIDDVAVLPAAALEDVYGLATTTEYAGYCQAEDDILATDTVTYRDVLYSVNGVPRIIHDPFTGVDENKIFELRRAQGA